METWKVGTEVRLRTRQISHRWIALPFDTPPGTISSRSALLGTLQEHKGSSKMCSQQAKLGTTSRPEVCSLGGATQLAVSVRLLIPIGVGLYVVVLNRAFAEKSKRKNCPFLLTCGVGPLLSQLAAWLLLKESRSAQTSWLQSCIEASHMWSLQLWDHLRLWYGVSGQHHSPLQLPLYRCSEVTSTLLPHPSAPSEGRVMSELNQKR